MAAFDINAFYTLKGPKTSSFEDFSGMVGKGFDLGRAAREQYDRNSAKALIAQREKEGIPYDAISNEVAKYDLDAANRMRSERRNSLEYNYRQSKEEFETWRVNMARRICGRILQIADAMNISPEERYKVLDTAASYVVTYDTALANMLWQQARSRYYEQGRLDNEADKIDAKNKPKEPTRKNLAQIALNANNLAETYDKKLNSNKYWAIKNYAVAAEIIAELEASKGVVAEYNDILLLLSKFKNRNREIDPNTMRSYAFSDKFRLINEGNVDLSKENISDVITPENVDSLGDVNRNKDLQSSPSSVTGNYGPKASAPDSSSSAGYSVSSMLDGVGEFPYISNKKFNDQLVKADGIEDNDEAIRYLTALKNQLAEDSGAANKGATKTEGADKHFFDSLDKKIAERQALKEGGFSPETAKTLKLNGKSGEQRTAEAARWQRIPTLISGYYTNAGALLPAMVRAILPEERTTDQDVNRVILSELGGDKSKFDALFNAIAASDDSLISSLLKQGGYEQAIRSVAPVVMDKMIKEYKSLVKSNGNDNEKVNRALSEAYNFDENTIKYLTGEYVLQKDKSRYETVQKLQEAENEKREKEAYDRQFGNGGTKRFGEEDFE